MAEINNEIGGGIGGNITGPDIGDVTGPDIEIGDENIPTVDEPKKIATFKWFTDTYTRGSWESGVSDNMFNTSRTNVSATSNKAINYNDLINPSSYSYNGNNIGATTNKCLEQTDITNLMRPTNFTVDITKDTNSNGTADIYIICTDFDSTATSLGSGGYPIKLEVLISNGASNIYNVNVNYPGGNYGAGDYFVINNVPSFSIIINRVSVFRGNTTAPYIVKPQITFNYATGLQVSVSGQASNFATVGSAITNYVPGKGDDSGGDSGDNPGGGSGDTTGTQLFVQSGWYSLEQAINDDLFSGICYAYIQSRVDTNIYEIRNSKDAGNILAYVEDETKNMYTLVGKYVAFSGEMADISAPMFIARSIEGSGDYI